MKLSGLLCVVTLFLAGCATVGKTTKLPSAIPVDAPILPAVVYMPQCPDAKKKQPLLDEILANPHDPGFHFCTRLVRLMSIGLLPAGKDANYIIEKAKMKNIFDEDGDAHATLIPDHAAEKSIDAAYRILVGTPGWYRSGGVNAYMPSGVTVNVMLKVFDVANNRLISKTAITVHPDDMLDAVKSVLHRFKSGLYGPRCAVYKHGVFDRWPACKTFALPIPEDD